MVLLFFYKRWVLNGLWTTRGYTYLYEVAVAVQQWQLMCLAKMCALVGRLASCADTCHSSVQGLLLTASCGLVQFWGAAAKAALLSVPPVCCAGVAVCAAVFWAELRNQRVYLLVLRVIHNVSYVNMGIHGLGHGGTSKCSLRSSVADCQTILWT